MDHPFARYRPLIDDWDRFTAALERPLPVFACPHPNRWSADAFDAWLRSMDWEPETMPVVSDLRRLPAGCRLGGRWQFFAGLYQVMQWTSAVAVEVLAPQAGERVLDLCASPGMKTARLALKMENTGTVVANELNRRRIKALRQTVERMGLLNVSLLEHDGANLPATAGPYDRVLVDAPCSCEGTTRKFSTQLHEDQPFFYRGKTGVQLALLRKAVQLCRSGGTIVYCTCTYAPEENEGVVDAILREYPEDIEIDEIAQRDQLGQPGLTHWAGQDYAPELARTLRIWPHDHDCAGFFIARLRKRSPALDETLPPVLQPEAAADLMEWLSDRFGIPAETLDGLHLHRDGELDALAVPVDHRPPVVPQPLRSGLLAMRTHVAVPKLTVPGALAFGPDATRNRLSVTEQQAALYVQRQVFGIDAPQANSITPGYVLLEREGQVMGLGLLQQGETGWEVRSMFPRRWLRTRRSY